MLYPEFRCAKLDSHGESLHIPKYIAKKILLYFCQFVIIFIICFGIACLIKAVYNPKCENSLLDLISVCASFITVFSAFIAAVSLLGALFMRKYKENLHLLENRYLDGNEQSTWDFFKRYSNARSSKDHGINYILISATYMLYANNPQNALEILVPILDADFHDVSCIAQIIRIRKFIPIYQKYLESEEKKFLAEAKNKTKMTPNRPFYYFPLPHHLIALYKNILAHKICKTFLIYCFILIIFIIGLAVALAI